MGNAKGDDRSQKRDLAPWRIGALHNQRLHRAHANRDHRRPAGVEQCIHQARQEEPAGDKLLVVTPCESPRGAVRERLMQAGVDEEKRGRNDCNEQNRDQSEDQRRKAQAFGDTQRDP